MGAPVAAIASKDLQPGEASPKEVSFDPPSTTAKPNAPQPADAVVDANSNPSYAMEADDSDADSIATDVAVGDLDILGIYGPQPNGDLWRVVRVKDWSVNIFEGETYVTGRFYGHTRYAEGAYQDVDLPRS